MRNFKKREQGTIELMLELEQEWSESLADASSAPAYDAALIPASIYPLNRLDND